MGPAGMWGDQGWGYVPAQQAAVWWDGWVCVTRRTLRSPSFLQEEPPGPGQGRPGESGWDGRHHTAPRERVCSQRLRAKWRLDAPPLWEDTPALVLLVA